MFSVATHGTEDAAEGEALNAMQKFINEGVSLHESRLDAKARAIRKPGGCWARDRRALAYPVVPLYNNI